jgi:hypothetical protein
LRANALPFVALDAGELGKSGRPSTSVGVTDITPMPCADVFDRRARSQGDSALPRGVRRIATEAGGRPNTLPRWQKNAARLLGARGEA